MQSAFLYQRTIASELFQPFGNKGSEGFWRTQGSLTSGILILISSFFPEKLSRRYRTGRKASAQSCSPELGYPASAHSACHLPLHKLSFSLIPGTRHLSFPATCREGEGEWLKVRRSGEMKWCTC